MIKLLFYDKLIPSACKEKVLKGDAMQQKYNYYKWMCLIGFTLLYNTVYIGRFNFTNILPNLYEQISATDNQNIAINVSIYISYAIGSLINGRIADKFQPKNIITFGVMFSVIANILIILAVRWYEIFLICFFNGYFQSMIWIGGMCLIVNWWKSKDRGAASGFANFASGMSHVTAYLVPIGIGMAFPYLSWKAQFAMPALLILVCWLIFWFMTKNNPEEVNKQPYIEDNALVVEREAYLKSEVLDTHNNPWRYFFTRPKFIWWCAIAILSSLCRYGLLKWVPIYYATSKTGDYIMNPTFINLILPIGMAFGTLILTWLTAKKFILNKGIMVICSAAMCGSLMLIFPTINSTAGILLGIFSTGFFLYGINGILWIYAMDRGGRVYTGTTVGILNCCAYLGATLEAFVFPMVIKIKSDVIYVFIVMEIICILMVICGMFVSEQDTEVEEEEPA